jgi:hypothetical protein
MSDTFYEGNPVVISMTFEVAGTPTDPTTVVFRVRQPDGTITVYTFPAAEIANPGVGVYILTLPGTLEPFTYNGRIEGTGAVTAAEEFEFTILPSPTLGTQLDPGPQAGPCTPWVDGESVAAQCGVTMTGSDAHDFDVAAVTASMLLYEFSGGQYSGQCSQLVRPCGSDGACGWTWAEILSPSSAQNWAVSWAFGPLGWGWWFDDATPTCGCRHVPRVMLANYPVVRIDSVLIDGVAVDPTTYILRENRYLDRLTPAGEELNVWPSCQNMRRPLGEAGTWSVSYTSGVEPPLPGVLAAQELGCEIYKALQGAECKLPSGATSLVRQGVTMTRTLFTQWQNKKGEWATGMVLVDAFLSAYNPTGQRQRSSVWSPDLETYPRPVG